MSLDERKPPCSFTAESPNHNIIPHNNLDAVIVQN